MLGSQRCSRAPISMCGIETRCAPDMNIGRIEIQRRITNVSSDGMSDGIGRKVHVSWQRL